MDKERFAKILDDLNGLVDIGDSKIAAACVIAASNIYCSEMTEIATQTPIKVDMDPDNRGFRVFKEDIVLHKDFIPSEKNTANYFD